MINDEEALLESIRDYVQANLNAAITAINTEKNDDYSIDAITADDNHYVFAGELQEIPNYPAFVNFAFDGDIESKTNKTGRIAIPNIVIEVCFDNPKTHGTFAKSMRYMRALYEIMNDYEPSAVEADGLQITKMVPMIVANNRRELVVSGVGITLAIGG